MYIYIHRKSFTLVGIWHIPAIPTPWPLKGWSAQPRHRMGAARCHGDGG